MNQSDARVRYTRMVIEDCFLDLLKSKPVSRITVTELCKKAQINRATFYKHYLDIPDLLEKLEDAFFRQIQSIFENHAAQFDLEAFNLEIVTWIYRSDDRYILLASDHGDPLFPSKIFLLFYEHAFPMLKNQLLRVDEPRRQYLYYFLSHGAGGILTRWFRDGLKESPEEIASLISQFSHDLVRNIKNLTPTRH